MSEDAQNLPELLKIMENIMQDISSNLDSIEDSVNRIKETPRTNTTPMPQPSYPNDIHGSLLSLIDVARKSSGRVGDIQTKLQRIV